MRIFALKHEISTMLGPIDLSSKSLSKSINVMGSLGVNREARSFSCIDVQRIAEGTVSFFFGKKLVKDFAQIDLLEFLGQLLWTCQNTIITGEAGEFVFPNSDHRLTFTPQMTSSNLVSVLFVYGDMEDVYFDKPEIDLILFYRSVWNANLSVLNKLHEFQPELFQYRRFTTQHPGAKKFANIQLPQLW